MEDEQRRKRKAMGISAGIHISLLLLFVLVLAWKEPNPPIPEYGIELNFGLEQSGEGEVQPEAAQVEDTQEPEETDIENTEEQTEVQQTENAEDTQVEETAQQEPDETQIVPEEISESESPDVVPAEETSEEKNTPVESDSQNDKVLEEQQEQTENTSGGTTQSDKPNNETSDGDKPNETGDQGIQEGSVDERALYGAEGSNTGASLEMAGWNWDFLPKPNDNSQESGKIVFQVTIDDEGYITRIVTLEKTVTPGVEKKYKDAIQELTFSKKSGYKPAPFSTGRITFIIKSN